jgi:hypothetical protein
VNQPLTKELAIVLLIGTVIVLLAAQVLLARWKKIDSFVDKEGKLLEAASKVDGLVVQMSSMANSMAAIEDLARRAFSPENINTLNSLSTLVQGEDRKGGMRRELARSRGQNHWLAQIIMVVLDEQREHREALHLPPRDPLSLPSKDQYIKDALEREGLL